MAKRLKWGMKWNLRIHPSTLGALLVESTWKLGTFHFLRTLDKGECKPPSLAVGPDGSKLLPQAVLSHIWFSRWEKWGRYNKPCPERFTQVPPLLLFPSYSGGKKKSLGCFCGSCTYVLRYYEDNKKPKYEECMLGVPLPYHCYHVTINKKYSKVSVPSSKNSGLLESLRWQFSVIR